MEQIILSDNLHEAWLRAVRGKRDRAEARCFAAALDEHIDTMQRELAAGTYRFGDYRRFTVWDPKQRTICAAPMRDRVAMHAMMRVCHPVFDAYQVHDSYASRPGKGTYAALDRVQTLARHYGWYAKLDMVKYFDSIDHAVMLSQLRGLFKDAVLLSLWAQLVDGYHTAPRRGLPIGNLTSQYFANHYLAPSDHWLHERLGVAAAVRYMDDVLLFATTRSALTAQVEAYANHVRATLHLELHEPLVGRCRAGIPFLGYVVSPTGRRLGQRSRHRFRHRLSALAAAYAAGRLSADDYRRRLAAVYAFVQQGEAVGLMRRVASEQGVEP